MIWIVKRNFKKKINSEEIWSYKTCLYSFFLELHNNIFQRSERNTTGDTFCCLILRSMHLIRGLSFMHWCTKWREKKKRDEFSNFNLMTTSVMIPMSEKFLIFYFWLHVPLHLEQHSLAILMMLCWIFVGCRFVELCWRIYVSWDFNERERLLVLLLLLHDGIDYGVWKIWLIAFYTDVDRWTRDVDNRSKLFFFPLNIFLSLYLS